MWRVRRPTGATKVLWKHISQVAPVLGQLSVLLLFYQECARASCWCLCLRELQRQCRHNDRILHRCKKLTVLSPFRSCLWRHSDNKRQDGSLHLQSVQRDRRRCWRGGEKSVQQDGTASQDVPPRRHLLEWQQDHHKVGWEAPTKAPRQCNHGGLSGKGQGTRVVHIQALKATGCNLILSQDSWHNWLRQQMHWHKIDKWTNPVALGMPVGRCGSSMSSGCLFCSAPLEARIINHWIKTKTVKQEHKPSLTVMQGNKPI